MDAGSLSRRALHDLDLLARSTAAIAEHLRSERVRLEHAVAATAWQSAAASRYLHCAERHLRGLGHAADLTDAAAAALDRHRGHVAAGGEALLQVGADVAHDAGQVGDAVVRAAGTAMHTAGRLLP